MIRMVMGGVLRMRLVEPDRPAIAHLLFRQIHAAVVPHVAVVEAAVARLHGDERRFRRVARGLLEEGGARRARVRLAPVEEGRDGRDAARLAELVEEGAPVAGVVGAAEVGARGGVGAEGCGGGVEELGVEEGEGILEGVGLGTRDGALDRCGVEAVGDKARDEEVDGVFETASVIARVGEEEALFGRVGCFIDGARVVAYGEVDFVLGFELGAHFAVEVGIFEEFTELRRGRKDNFVIFRNHALVIV